jgi:predicted transcriptional regulator
MKYTILTKVLLQIGLTDFEAKIYEYLVFNPNLNITNLAKEFSTNRINIYRAMEKLKKLELIAQIENGSKKKSYKILPPTKLQSLIQYQEIELSRMNKELGETMPFILDNFSIDKKDPKIQIFEGRRNFMILLNNMVDGLIPDSEILWLAEGDELYSLVGEDYFNLELAGKSNIKNVSSRILSSNDNSEMFELKKRSKDYNYEIKKLPKGFSTIATISIAGDKTILWNTVNPRAILINDMTISRVFRDIFDFMWKEVD